MICPGTVTVFPPGWNQKMQTNKTWPGVANAGKVADMNPGGLIVRCLGWLVVLLFVLRWWASPTVRMEAPPTGWRGWVPRAFWTGAALANLCHALLAFAIVYGWSHDTFVEEVVLRTQENLGISLPWLVHLTYASVILWLLDALWSWVKPASWWGRVTLVQGGIRGLLSLALMLNVAAFADGPIRWVGVVAVTLAAASRWCRTGCAGA